MGKDIITLGQLKHELTVAEMEDDAGPEGASDNTIDEETCVASAAVHVQGFFELALNLGITKDCFSHPRPRTAWCCAGALFEDGQEPTFQRVIAKSKDLGLFDEIGGARHFRLFKTLNRDEAEEAAGRILENHHRRQTQTSLSRVLKDVTEGLSRTERGVSEAIQEVQTTLDTLQERQDVSSYGFSLNSALRDCAEVVRHGTAPALATGFYDLDSYIGGGLRPGELHVIAGRTSMGKSAFALSILTNIAERTRKKVALLTLEMPAQQIIQRLIVQKAHVPINRLRWDKTRKYDAPSDDETVRIGAAMKTLMNCPIELIDRRCHQFDDVCGHIRRLSAAGCPVVIIDGLWLMRGDGKQDLRIELKRMTGMLKELSIKYEMSIVAVHQINRGVEKLQDQRPSVSDLRDSSIEDDCDTVLALYRSEYYLKDNTPEDDRGTGECLILKNRNGPTGKVHLRFAGEFMQWQNLTTKPLGEPASHGKDKRQ